MSEIAVLLSSKDSKTEYEESITFLPNDISLSNCEETHPDDVVEIKEQTKPFLCTKCTKYYSKL